MRFRNWFTTLMALLLIANVIDICFEGNASGDDTQKLPAPVAAAKAPKETTTARAKIDGADLDKAQLDAWHKNIAEWKDCEPGEPADNSFCNVCHANLEDEILVQIHLPEGVGCETCHGISDKHSEDEDSLVPPDVIFAKSKIALFCIQCHDQEELIESESAHKNLFATIGKPHDSAAEPKTDEKNPATEKKTKTCTDCHDFEHKLKNRTRRWNKDTRKIEWFDGVRMMQARDNK
jgi:hypothetical protein